MSTTRKIMPRLISKSRTPKIFWYQSDNNVIIRIMLCDVKDYFLKVQADHLRFSATVDDKEYCLCFQLFGAVLPHETDHTNLGREIKIFLSKAHKFLDWLRLTYYKEKNDLIARDPDHLYKTDWSNPRVLLKGRESFQDFKIRNNIQNIAPVVPSSDEEESDDERLCLTACD